MPGYTWIIISKNPNLIVTAMQAELRIAPSYPKVL